VVSQFPDLVGGELTARQRRILEFIRNWVERHGYPPSVREIGEAVGLVSPSSVAYQLKELEKKGFLRRDPNRPRAVDVRAPSEAIDDELSRAQRPTPAYVPMLGRIAAGGPILAEQAVEDIFPLPRELVGEGEVFMLEDINSFAFPGLTFESYTPEHTVKDGDKLQLAGFEIDVIGTPGHSPDHVTYSIAADKAMFSGDVLFQGSIGRTDLPGCDHDTLMASIAKLLDTLPDDTGVLPGHMDPTTLGQERRSNPFLQALAGR
jgi:hypothetical protein